MKYTYSFLVLTLTFVLFSIIGNAQCTSDAGTYPPDDVFICDRIIPAPIPSGLVLDDNDGIDFIQFTDPLDPLNSLTRISLGRRLREPRNVLINPLIGDTAIYIAAIVGDTLPRGEVDWDDPCLSISNSFKIIVSDFECSVEVIETVGCFTTESTLIAKASGGTPPYTFLWSGGHQDDTLKVFGVGAFGVTITDAENCSTQCVGFINEPVPFNVTVRNFCVGDSTPIFLQGVPPFNGYIVPTAIDAVVLDTIFFNDENQKLNLLPPELLSFDYNFTDSIGCDTSGTIFPEDFMECLPGINVRPLANTDDVAVSLFCVSNPQITGTTIGPGGLTYDNFPIITSTSGRYCYELRSNGCLVSEGCFTLTFHPDDPVNGHTLACCDKNFSQIDGQIILDQNQNCQADSSETGIRDVIVTSLESGLEVETDEEGFFTMPSRESSNHGLVFETNSRYTKCIDTVYVNVGKFDTVAIKIPFQSANIIGNILLDNERDCQLTSTDTPLDCWIVSAFNPVDTFYATTQLDGSYMMPVSPGSYTVDVIESNHLFETCLDSQQVTIVNTTEVVVADFLVRGIEDCPLLEVEVGAFQARRCFVGTLPISYCNYGTIDAENVQLELVLDSLIFVFNSSLPVTQVADTLFFDLGNLAPFECGNIELSYQISCNAVLDQTLCTEAIIFPNNPCPAPDSLWSGASLAINAECTGDSIHFTIKNVGTGTMTQAREYIVIEDAAIMRVSNPFTLGAGGVETGSIAATGSTFRLEVEQEENHPGFSMPSITIERCGTEPFSTGFVTQLPLDDADPFVDIQCEEVRGSFDPNDKQAEPKGFSSEHFIEPNTDLEYTIRFQNTGNDTAFTVEIIDTLSQFLDVGSVNPGVSSHDYRFEVFETGILRFTFNDILLVDSFTNEPGSNGFVKYSIAQKADIPIGSVIRNAADIYFDFNDPIHTNQTFHTVGRDFITVNTQEVFVPGATVNVYPNPFNDKATFELNNVMEGQKTLRLLDISGKVVYSQTVNSERFVLERKNLNSGFYFYEILGEGAKIATGKLVVE